MRNRLLWKLLLTNILPVIGIIFLVVWLAVDKLAAGYFMALMKIYEISPRDIHQMFLTSIHYSLVWASLAALGLAFILSYLLTRRVLRPLSQMAAITKEIAAGNFSLRAEIATSDEVGQLGIAFNNMADRLGRMEQLRKAMVADVAHELRTPLTNLRGYLEALNDGVIPPTPATLQMLQEENLRLVHLVESLQQLARADAARAYLKREEIVLAELVDQMVELHRLAFQKKHITVTTQYHDQGARLTADRDKLLQAIRNLLDNCCKYTPEKGWVTIAVNRGAEGLRVDFKNSGPGIAAEDLPYIFERFFRADRSRSRDKGGETSGGGAGIGLAITKELIEAHGGTVGAASSPDDTDIWFILPL